MILPDVDSNQSNFTISVDVILPCLNEALALPFVLQGLPTGYNAIVVDNGSTDSSRTIAEQNGVQVLDEQRRGVGAAINCGIASATSEYVCVMDCDATVDPRLLTLMIEPLVQGRTDLVVAPRQFTTGSAGFARRQFFRASGRLVSTHFGISVSDLGSAQAFRRTALLADLPYLDRRNGWTIDLIRAASQRGLRITSVPLPFLPRLGKSKITGTVRGTVLTALDTLRVLMK